MVDIAAPVEQVVADALAGVVDRTAAVTPDAGVSGAGAADAAAPFAVDLQSAPFNLDDDAVAWVESTIDSMSD